MQGQHSDDFLVGMFHTSEHAELDPRHLFVIVYVLQDGHGYTVDRDMPVSG